MALMLSHFTRTGTQDCLNTVGIGDLHEAWIALGRPTDPEAAINVVRESWGDDDAAAWIAQNEFEGLDPRACYEAWRDAWQACAAGIVRGELPSWISIREEEIADRVELNAQRIGWGLAALPLLTWSK